MAHETLKNIRDDVKKLKVSRNSPFAASENLRKHFTTIWALPLHYITVIDSFLRLAELTSCSRSRLAEVFLLISHRASVNYFLLLITNKKWYWNPIWFEFRTKNGKLGDKWETFKLIRARFSCLPLFLRCQEMLIYQFFTIKFQRIFESLWWWFKWVVKAVKSIRFIIQTTSLGCECIGITADELIERN